MALWQKLALGLIALVMGLTAALTWGSIGSAVMILSLILMGSALLWRRHVLREPDLYE